MGLFDQINTASNSNEAVTKEKHLPIINIEEAGNGKHKIKIDVGDGKHPNEIDHWIQWVELRVDDMYIGKADFSAKIMDPIVEFTVACKNPCQISVVARCNKHGLWQTTMKCSD